MTVSWVMIWVISVIKDATNVQGIPLQNNKTFCLDDVYI